MPGEGKKLEVRAIKHGMDPVLVEDDFLSQ